MKNIKYITLAIIALVATSCNDDFLERFPLDELTNETFWNTETDLSIYTGGLYDSFFGQASSGESALILWDNQSDNQAPVPFNSVVAGQHTVSRGTLGWSFLRRCNFFLENYNNNPGAISEEVKNRYKGEVLMFRAMHVAGRVKSYGDIPFTTKVLNIDDTDVLYGPRVPRAEVMAQVLADLNEAVALIPENIDEEGRMNKWAAQALRARVCLHEGTFRKYHGLGGEEPFLNAAKDAAEAVINSGAYSLYSTGEPTKDFAELFKQLSLDGNSEAILYQKFIRDVVGHGFVRFMPGSETGLTNDFVQDFLCVDGLPIGLSPLYQGDSDLDDLFANRDPRLAQTILPPSIGFWPEGNDEEVQPRLAIAAGAGSSSSTGYHITKYYNEHDQFTFIGGGESDIHIIRYAEVLLIYAEVMEELGMFDQGVADATINLLRDRVGVAHMNVATLQRDPDSDMVASAGYLDNDVSIVLEEIRRERRVELAAEGHRYDDLMRWRAGKFLTKRIVGAKWDAFKDLTTVAGAPIYAGANPDLDSEGYLDIYSTTLSGGAVFDSNKHYLFGYPTEELAINPALLPQNPGWEE